MTDALWNGIIGAGGAAICCAVYYSFKAIKKGATKIKVPKLSTVYTESNTTQIENPTMTESTNSNENHRKITISIPPFSSWCTMRNFRALCFLAIAIYCFNIPSCLYSPYVSNGVYLGFEGDFYNNVAGNLKGTVANTAAIHNLLYLIAKNLFYVIGFILALIGITGFDLTENSGSSSI